MKCNGKVYQKVTQICCKGQLYENRGIALCCGEGVYYPLSGYVCVDGKSVKKIVEKRDQPKQTEAQKQKNRDTFKDFEFEEN